MKKVIGIDARMWAHAGIGRYVRELSRALLRIASPSRFLFFGQEALLRPTLGADASIEPATSPIYGLAEQVEMARLFRKVAALHVPHFNVPFFGKGPFIVTVHDLIHLREPGVLTSPLARAYVRMLLGHVASHAAAILTVSEATKSDLLNEFQKLDSGRVFVIHEAASEIFKPNTMAPAERIVDRSHFKLEKPYVLCVGSLKPHKNISLLVRAIGKLRSQSGLDVEAAIVGRLDPKHPEILKEIQNADGVRYLGEVSDEELLHLYNDTTALVLPSFREGFGLPVVEAMACGTPVLLSRRASLPEIAGEAGLYFEPDRVDEFSELLYTVFKNKDLRQKMAQLSLARASAFTWERTARQTLAVYDQVLG